MKSSSSMFFQISIPVGDIVKESAGFGRHKCCKRGQKSSVNDRVEWADSCRLLPCLMKLENVTVTTSTMPF